MTGNVVLAELIWTLKSFYGADKDEIARRVKGIIQLRGLKVVDNYNAMTAIELYQNKSIKFIDALIASIKLIQEKSGR